MYWHSNDPEVLREFIEADKLRQKRRDEDAWMYGAYVKKAIESSICNAFIGKNDKPMEYPETPVSYKNNEKEEEKRRLEAENERLRLVMLLDRVREQSIMARGENNG